MNKPFICICETSILELQILNKMNRLLLLMIFILFCSCSRGGLQRSKKEPQKYISLSDNHEFDELFFHSVKPAVESHGLVVLKADSIFKPGNILSQVWSQIRSAEILIADVSDQNPNVIFELGLCYGIQRCPILLTRDASELPFNIRNLRYIQYENTITGDYKLSETLKITVGKFLSAVRNEA